MEEGGRKVITNKYLEIRSLDYSEFTYNITVPATHGWLDVLEPNKVDVSREAAKRILNDQTEKGGGVVRGGTGKQKNSFFYKLLISKNYHLKKYTSKYNLGGPTNYQYLFYYCCFA